MTDFVNAPAEATPSAPLAEPISAPVSQPTTPAATPAGATPSIPEGYVPSYRLREAREAAVRQAQEQWAAREAELDARYKETERKLHALVGVTPPADPEIDTVRQQFARLYPGLAKMEERAGDFMGVLDKAGDLESQNKHYWESYGRQTMDRLLDHASKSLGSPLTSEGKRALHSSFVGFVQSSPELISRYSSDPTLVEEFWNTFTSNFIDPSRRAAAATVIGRAPGAIPQDTPGGAPRVAQPAGPQNLDERVASGWKMYDSTAKK